MKQPKVRAACRLLLFSPLPCAAAVVWCHQLARMCLGYTHTQRIPRRKHTFFSLSLFFSSWKWVQGPLYFRYSVEEQLSTIPALARSFKITIDFYSFFYFPFFFLFPRFSTIHQKNLTVTIIIFKRVVVVIVIVVVVAEFDLSFLAVSPLENDLCTN